MLSDTIAEKVVLAGLYQHGADMYYEIADIINADSFTDEAHQGVFLAIQNCYLTKNINIIDFPSLVATINEIGYSWIINNKNEISHLKSVINTSTGKDSIRTWCVKLRKLQTANQLKIELQDAQKELEKVDGSQSFNEIISYAESPIVNFTQSLEIGLTKDIVSLSSGIDKFLDDVEANPVDIVGISTGYPKLDNQIGGGLRDGAITLIGARTGFGKSLLSINIGLFVSIKMNIPVLYIDTEMKEEDHWPRIIANITYDNDFQIPIGDVEKGKYVDTPGRKQSVDIARKLFKKSKFDYAPVKGKPFEEHLSRMRKWLYKNVGFNNSGKVNDCLIIYDYFKLGDASVLAHNIQERQALAFMMMQMADFGGKYDFPLLIFTQLNRDGLNQADQSVIRGSDSALDPVTNFCIFQPKSREEIGIDTIEKGNAKMTVVKSRHGEVHEPGQYLSFFKVGKYAKILEVK